MPTAAVAGADLVLLETDAADEEWTAWAREVGAAADARTRLRSWFGSPTPPWTASPSRATA
jgi:hypothetical protein